MFFMLIAVPFLLLVLSFTFGVGLQLLGLVSEAKRGGLLGGLGSVALSILILSFICLPGYVVGVLWFVVLSSKYKDDFVVLKKLSMFIPLVSLSIVWLPAVFVPNMNFGERIIIAGLTMLIALIAEYLWLGMVRFVLWACSKFCII